MKDENINKIAAQVAELHFAEDLPAEIDSFKLKKFFAADGDKFIFFSYDNDEIHCVIKTYFHEETAEFKVSQSIGLTEFCLTKFFTEDLARFKELLDTELADVLKNLRGLRGGKINRFLRELKLDAWIYGQNLPATLEGFELFISPAAPVEVTNGSFIVINYADFNLNSDFVLYRNIYTDEFSGERRICGATHITYAFDAKTLDELEAKLKKNLVDELREIRLLSTAKR
ncbi:MAG: hypothetical protein J5497_05995 [Selenomonadaceae bacterium]|nr:hypothetical protein [Selenomonadaceae bacterium]